ncbi:MAG: PQQ-binding-like beta-propeller repeat protein [Clostridiales bacterium]|nr:PQQ-binding-like beta-propeller repeat protein [Clostridiales bacterium]
MIDFYNAFISYKHAPLDSKVAEHVQRSLEHFSIPRAIRKKTGRKKIERIFRDKEELPITSDLTDTISNALEKAEYLIVICSPNTKKSIWVQREIKFFLKNHTKKQILTVLAEGEPYDVIPEELTFDERTVTEYTGETHQVKIPIEPLSCDYRMPLRKAKKTEIPRLASALIGCSYDELVRRQRQYHMRRVIAISTVLVAAAVGLAGYFFYSSKRINESYMQSLISQSKYLANESSVQLDNNMRTDALYLAMAALPQDENDPRPVTGEAVEALANATLAYRGVDGLAIESLWNYSSGNDIRDFEINTSGTRLSIYDSIGVVSVWSTETHEKLYEVHSGGDEVKQMIFGDDETLILFFDDHIEAYDGDDGELAWNVYLREEYFVDANSTVNDGELICATSAPSLMKIDISNGHTIDEYDLSTDDNYGTLSRLQLSPDGTRVGLYYYFGLSASHAGVYDLQSETLTLSDEISSMVANVGWADDDHFVVASFDIDGTESSRFNDVYVLQPDVNYLTCFDPSDMSVIWEAEQESTSLNLDHDLVPLSANGFVGFFAGNKFCCYDIEDGTLEYEWTTNEAIVTANDRDGDGWPLMFTKDGGLVVPRPGLGTNVIRLTYEFVDSIQMLKVNHGVYVLQEHGHDLIYYNTGVHDEDWEQTSGVTLQSVTDQYLDDNILALLSIDDLGSMLTLIDPEDNSLITTERIGEEGDYSMNFKILGADDEDLFIVYTGIAEGVTLYRVDIEDGDIDTQILSDSYVLLENSATYNNGYVTYIHRTGSSIEIGVYDNDSNHTEEYSVPVNSDDLMMAPVYYDSMGIIYVVSADDEFIVNTEEDEYLRVDLPDDWNGAMYVTEAPATDSVIVSDGSLLISVDVTTGQIRYTINTDGRIPLGAICMEDDASGDDLLVVAYNDSNLYRYDLSDGSFIGKSEISTYYNYVPTASFELDRENGYLYVQMYQLTDVISLDTWTECTYIENCFGHYAPRDLFYTQSWENSGEVSVGYFRHYTVQDLIDRANDMLGGIPMSDEFRSRYGL